MSVSPTTNPPTRARAAHLLPLAPGWNLWRSICLRGTGFPVSVLEPFGAPEAARAADALDAAEAARERAQNEATGACIAGRRRADADGRTAWNRAARKLAGGRVPDLPAELESLRPFVESLAHANAAADAAKTDFERLYAESQARELRLIAGAVSEPRFRTAVIWQNREAFRHNLLPLAAEPAASRTSRRRMQERLALSYIQRYAARNESIGFFGPVGWGTFAGTGPPIALVPGAALVAARFIEFEPWLIHGLADRLSRVAELRPWFTPRLDPFLRLADGKLYGPDGRAVGLRPDVYRLLTGCDGACSARDIAAELAGDPDSGFASEKDVFAALAELARRRVVIWRLDLPVGNYPERRLARFFERVGDAPLRRRLTAELDSLVAARDRIAAARTPDALDAAFAALEERQARLAVKAKARPPRSKGRAVCYEDCRRDVSLTLGPDVAARLGPPLGLVLASARWFTDGVALRVYDAIARIYGRLRRELGTDDVPFAVLWRRVLESGAFSDSYLGPVLTELQERWAKLLPLDSPERRVTLDIRELALRVRDAFPARESTVPCPLHQSPDVMIAAVGADAIARGDYRFVLGEIHAGAVTQMQTLLLRLHPHPEELVKAVETDAGRPRVRVTWSEPSRDAFVSFSKRDFELSCNTAAPTRPPERVLRIADLVAHATSDSIWVRTRDGAHRFHVLDLFYHQLLAWAPPRLKLFRPTAHGPRITLDNFVFKRESWSFAAADPPFAAEKNDAARFRAARAWARTHGLPRRIFMRFPHRKKPVYADLESPAFVDLVAHFWRAALREGGEGPVTVIEMLPGLDETWLVDAHGNRYTSELRLTAVAAPESAA